MSNDAAIPEKARVAEGLAFGGAQFANCIFPAFAMYYLLGFYTDVALIPPGAAAVLVLILRLVSAFDDHAVGLYMNRTQFRDGKYRPYFKWCALPYAVSLTLLCCVPVTSVAGKIAFAAVTLFACEFFSSTTTTAAYAMIPYLAKGDVGRTKFVSFSNGSSILAFIVVSTLLLPMANFLGGGNRQIGMPMTMTLFALMVVPLHFNAYFRLKERHFGISPSRAAIKDLVLTIVRNRRLLLFLLGYGIYGMANGFKAQTTYFYLTYNLGRPDMLPFVFLAGLASPLAMQLVIPRLLKLAEKETLIVLGLFGACAASLSMLAAGDNPYALILCIMVFGAFTAVSANLVFAVMASFTDEINANSRIKMSEVLSATMGLSTRLGGAVTSAVSLMVLALTGYAAPSAGASMMPQAAVQSPTALMGIKALFIFFTAAGMLLAGLTMLRFRMMGRR